MEHELHSNAGSLSLWRQGQTIMLRKFSLYGILIGSAVIGAHAGAESEDCGASDADTQVTLCGSVASKVDINNCLDNALSKTNAALASSHKERGRHTVLLFAPPSFSDLGWDPEWARQNFSVS